MTFGCIVGTSVLNSEFYGVGFLIFDLILLVQLCMVDIILTLEVTASNLGE